MKVVQVEAKIVGFIFDVVEVAVSIYKKGIDFNVDKGFSMVSVNAVKEVENLVN